MTRVAHVLPSKLEEEFLILALMRGDFWYDMFYLSLSLNLTNCEVRNLRTDNVDIIAKSLKIHDTKQNKSIITRSANKAVHSKWVKEAKPFLANVLKQRGVVGVEVLMDVAQTDRQFEKIAHKYNCLSNYRQKRKLFYEKNIFNERKKAAELARHDKLVDLSKDASAAKILKTRCEIYKDTSFLFPSIELNSNRCQQHQPISRQTSYRAVKSICEKLKQDFEEYILLRLGLNSCYKLGKTREIVKEAKHLDKIINYE